MISALFLIAEIYSTANLKTYTKIKICFNTANRHPSSEESLKEKRHTFWYVFPFYFVSQSSQISKMERSAK